MGQRAWSSTTRIRLQLRYRSGFGRILKDGEFVGLDKVLISTWCFYVWAQPDSSATGLRNFGKVRAWVREHGPAQQGLGDGESGEIGESG